MKLRKHLFETAFTAVQEDYAPKQNEKKSVAPVVILCHLGSLSPEATTMELKDANICQFLKPQTRKYFNLDVKICMEGNFTRRYSFGVS